MSQSRPTASRPTEIAGRYEVKQELGKGAFGTVYKAKDKILDRMVAIKTIRLEGLAAAATDLGELLKRFEKEAKAAARLKHPNVLTIYDFGDADGLSYLAMEFIDGVGLDKVIAQGRLPLERAASIGVQVAEALDFAHQQNVVHRDIKPANIMLEAGDRVKVTDFGIAKVTDAAEHLTATGSLLGTPSYMSPEQAKGAPVDGRSDLFSVGCVLYEMLGGRKAFRGETITALIFKIISEEPPPLRELAADVPEAMLRIIAKALAKSPDARYPTGRALADDLLAFTRPSSLPTLRQAEVETTALPPAAMATPTLSAAAPTIETAPTTPVKRPLVSPLPPAPPPMPAPRPPAARRSGGGAGLLVGLGAAGLAVAAVAVFGFWYFFSRPSPPAMAPGETEGGPAVATTPTAAPPSAELPPPTPQATAAPAPAATPLPAAAARPTPRPPATVASAAPPPEARPAESAPSFLDEEPPPLDGRQAGEDLASKYRSSQGGGTGSYGSTTRFRQRPRSPQQLAARERPAVATLRHIIDAEEMFTRKSGRYGTLTEMASAQTLFLDVPFQAGSFRRAGYHFELTVAGDGFKVTAVPIGPGLRPFQGTETGYILAGVD